ncbi:MAG: flavodoxin domain-containing protein [Anaerolineaceae bacterium]|nr:flavodoxin domain-containing protein [Anaerolineaceae bacterium]
MFTNPIPVSNEPVLVAYATHSGSTKEVAEAVAAVLAEKGIHNELKPARQIRTLAGYRAVILGAPLYTFHWHRDALNFLSRQAAELMRLPVAIFALGPFHEEEEELQGARQQLDSALAKFLWLQTTSVQVFAGKFDPEKLGFPFRLLMAWPADPMRQAPRNWPQIDAWAEAMASELLEKRA